MEFLIRNTVFHLFFIFREDGTWSSLLGTGFPRCEERGCTFSESSLTDTGHVEVGTFALDAQKSAIFN